MRRMGTMGGGGMSLGLPPFTKAVKWIVISNFAIYFVMLLGRGLAPASYQFIYTYLGLIPPAVVHGYPGFHVPALWQLVTYGFLHAGFSHVLWNMFGIWMFGGQFEMDWGTRKFVEYYLWCVIAAGITTVIVGYIGYALYTQSPSTPLFGLLASLLTVPTVGASGGLFGILIAFGMYYGDREVMLFPLPFQIRAKYIVTAWILIALAGALGEGGQGVANWAHLGGAFFGWVYLRTMPRGGLQVATSEGYYGIRNRYYKWKRRQAAKKFEVYMKNHRREDFFDEYGNYKGPGARDDDKGNGDSRGPWVN
jgi:membrane associated rhomboid family serine protease